MKKKCWPGKWYLLGAAIVAVAVGVLIAIQFDPSYDFRWKFALRWSGIVLVWELGKAWLCTRPMGPWQVYEVDGDTVSARHLLTGRVRSMSLERAHLAQCSLMFSGRWVVLSHRPLTTVQEAKRLRRSGEALMLPQEKSLMELLHDRLKLVPELLYSPHNEEES